MRRNVLILGIILMSLGVILMIASGVAVHPDPQVEKFDKTANPPVNRLSVQGNLSEGNLFRVRFTVDLLSPEDVIHVDAAVIVNVTDPVGSNLPYEIPITLLGGQPYTETPFPQGIANRTGLYGVQAEGIWGVVLESLILERIVPQDPVYPYGILTPVGAMAMLVGVAASLWGATRASRKSRRTRSKQHVLTRKP